jgi:hypothetical protein
MHARPLRVNTANAPFRERAGVRFSGDLRLSADDLLLRDLTLSAMIYCSAISASPRTIYCSAISASPRTILIAQRSPAFRGQSVSAIVVRKTARKLT